MNTTSKTQVLNLMKTAKGQLEAAIKMTEDDRYCVDISKQILAVQALLKKANLEIIDQHIKHCVRQALSSGSPGDGDEKVNEIIDLIEKYAK